ncbi:MAG TPA: hypothetical protein VJH87_19895 [Vicinamibacteria bacterium]|nr:hypothetical protein [Vicinamibacteria bacterium]
MGGQEEKTLIIGPNVNMVSGTDFPGGDPAVTLQRGFPNAG